MSEDLRGPLDGLTARLESLEAAESEGDWERAFRLRRDLVDARFLEEVSSRASGASELDLRLLERLGVDLHLRGLQEGALGLWEAGRRYAERSRDAYTVRAFRVLQVHALVALLDFEMAERLLREMVEFGRGSAAQVVERLAQAEAERSAPDRPPQTVEILGALGRTWAAMGRLADADVALTWVLDRAFDLPEDALDRRQTAVLLAEVRLDAGRLEAFDGLRHTQGARRDESELGIAWAVLDGQAAALRGRLSEAIEHFAFVRTSARVAPTDRARTAASWSSFHALCFLNRLGEAETVLDDLARVGTVPQDELEFAAALLTARHAAGSAPGARTPSLREGLNQLQATPVPRRSASLEDVPPPASVLARTDERAVQDWARLTNTVHLALRRGDRSEAGRIHEALGAWLPSLQSPLLEARFVQLEALLAWTDGDAGRAWRRAREARDLFENLGVVREAWAASQVGSWVLDAVEEDEGEKRAWRERARALTETVSGHLTPRDRVLHGLNKTNVQDEAVEALVAQADDEERADAVEEVVERLLLLRAWELGGIGSPDRKRQPPDEARGEDLFSFAEAQLELSRDAGARGSAKVHRLRGERMPRDVALLVYAVLPGRLAAFLVDARGTERVPLAGNVARAEVWNTALRTVHDMTHAGTWSSDRAHPKRLSEMLGLEAVLAMLPSTVKRLYVAPDAMLVHVPFAALPVQGAPLARQVAVACLPRFRWIERPKRSSLDDILGVAVPQSRLAPELPPLRYAQAEVAALERLGAKQRTLCVDADATRESVMAALGSVQLAHLACHGEFFEQAPHASGLLLHDAWLRLRDFTGLTFENLELAVLGCCWGGDMTVLPGGEPVGLPATFLARGARHVIASLWQIEDDAGARFAKDLYGRLRTRATVDALADVQAAWSKTEPPRVWASYVAYARGVPKRGAWWRRIFRV